MSLFSEKCEIEYVGFFQLPPLKIFLLFFLFIFFIQTLSKFSLFFFFLMESTNIPFRDQKTGQRNRSINDLNSLIKKFGNDVCGLVEYIFRTSTPTQKEEITRIISNFSADLIRDQRQKIEGMMKPLSETHSQSGPHEKLQLLSIVSPFFKHAELKNLGFKASPKHFRNSRLHAKNHGSGMGVSRGGRKTNIDEKVKESIFELSL
jgi:hypothetical protein